ncbi:MAG: hypothetical protein RIB98_07485 [Acidimicrobiales bacterium]
MNSDPKNESGVTDGPKSPDTPDGDPDMTGPDGTKYDKDAVDEVRRKMKVDED